MTAQITSAQADGPGRRMAVSLSALAGIGYAAAWIISQPVGAPGCRDDCGGACRPPLRSGPGRTGRRCPATERPGPQRNRGRASVLPESQKPPQEVALLLPQFRYR